MDDTQGAVKGLRIRADWLSEPSLQAVFTALTDAGHEARVVGGAVRETLRGSGETVHATDIDLATTALPQETMDACKRAGIRVIATGVEHGTVTLVRDGKSFEVTTLRSDVATDGRRAVVAFTSDWTRDAQRRDFTINAIYCDRDGNVFDPVGGIADLADQRVRFIGDAGERIREDYLRILRYFRFLARFSPDAADTATLAACVRERHGLSRLSAERIQHELLTLLAAPRAEAAIDLMRGHGLLQFIIPEAPQPSRLKFLAAFERWLANHSDISTDCELRLFALAVHDTTSAARIAERLRLSNRTQARLTNLARWWRSVHEAADDPATLRKLAYLAGKDDSDRLLRLTYALRPLTDWNAYLHARADIVLPSAPMFPVSGRDLIDIGYAAGPELGQRLEKLRTDWIESDFMLSRDALLGQAIIDKTDADQ